MKTRTITSVLGAMCLWLGAFDTLRAEAPLDTDQDGLSDTEETNVYQTDPHRPDTDGDRQKDGAEVRAGTDPKNAASAFKILTPLSPLPGGGWRVSWTSVVGKRYRLQRLEGNSLSVTNGNWVDVGTVQGTGATGLLEDPGSGSGTQQRFYRVLLVEAGSDAGSPTVGAVQSDATVVAGETVVTLTVMATDDTGVTGVNFYDGTTLLGPGTRGFGDQWRFLWHVGPAANGTHALTARATDGAGNSAAASVPATVTVTITNQSACLNIGILQICADQLRTNSGIITASGNLRINEINLTAESSVQVNPSQWTVAGSGGVKVPGIGLVMNGSFEINAADGWLSVKPGTIPNLPPIAFTPQTLLAARDLSVNVLTNWLRGVGGITNTLPRQTLGPASFDGAFTYDPKAFAVALEGNFALEALSGHGKGTLNLADSTFTVAGFLNIASGAGTAPYSLTNATFTARLETNGLPRFDAAGQLSVPSVISLTVTGSVAADGSFRLWGQGATQLGSFGFSPCEATLTRTATNKLVSLGFKGTLQHAISTNLALEGSIDSEGIVELVGQGTARIGAFSFDPLALYLRRNQSTTNRFVLDVGGRLLQSDLKPIYFAGVAKEDGSVNLQGASGPYTILAFDQSKSLKELLEDPKLSFEEKVFLFSYRIANRALSASTIFGFLLTRAADQEGGAATLLMSATNTHATLAPWTLSGRVGDDGLYVLTGTTHARLDEFDLQNLELKLSRLPTKLVKCEVTAGMVAFPELEAAKATARGEFATDGTYTIDFQAEMASMREFAITNLQLTLSCTNIDEGATWCGVKGGGLSDLGVLGGTGAKVSGRFNPEGYGWMLFELGATSLFGYATSTLDVKLELTEDGTFTPTARARLNIPGFTDGLLAGTVSPLGNWSLSYKPEKMQIFDRTWGNYPELKFERPPGGSGSVSFDVPTVIFIPVGVSTLPFHISNTEVKLSGAVSPDGSFDLSGETDNTVFLGFPMTDYSIRLTHAAGSSATSLTVGMALATVGQKTQLGTHRFTGEITPEGNVSLSADQLTMTLNQFHLQAPQLRLTGRIGETGTTSLGADLEIPGLKSAASVRVTGGIATNDTFLLRGTANVNLGFNAITAGTIPAGATVELSQEGLLLTGTLAGELVTNLRLTVPPIPFKVSASGTVSDFGASLNVAPLSMGQFSLEGSTGGLMGATLNTNGLTLHGGAVLKYKGKTLSSLALPPLVFGPTAETTVRLDDQTLTVDGFILRGTRAKLTWGETSATLDIEAGSALDLPGMVSPTTVNVTGTIRSDGTYRLTGTATGTLGFRDITAGVLPAGATVELTQNGLVITGTLAGELVTDLKLTVPPFPIRVSASGNITNFAVALTPAALTLGAFSIEGAQSGLMQATLNTNGLTLHAGAVLKYKGQTISSVTLPPLQFGPTAETTVRLDGQTLTLNNFILRNSRAVFTWGNNTASLQIESGTTLDLPGLVSPVTANVTGNISSDGTYRIVGSTSANLGFRDISVGTLPAGGTVELTQNGLAITGTLAGYLITDLRLSVPQVRIPLTASGTATNFTVGVTAPTLKLGAFEIANLQGSILSATLDATGVTFNAGASLLYKGQTLASAALPPLRFSPNGTATFQLMLNELGINSYLIRNASCGFSRSNSIATLTVLSGATLNIPGLTIPGTVGVSGTLNQDGTFRLSGSTSGSLHFTGLPVGSVPAGATVELTQDDLTVRGTLAGQLMTKLNLALPPFPIRVSAAGGITFDFPTAVIPLMGFNELAITGPTGSNMTVTVQPNLVVVASGGQLRYRGERLGTFTLPGFSIDPLGNFGFSEGSKDFPIHFPLRGFPITNSWIRVTQTNNVARVEVASGAVNFSGKMVTVSVGVSGSLNSDGTFALNGETTGTTSLSGLPVVAMGAKANARLTEQDFTLTGGVTGGVLSLVGLGSAPATLHILPTGEATLSAFGNDFTVPPIPLGTALEMYNLLAHLSSEGLEIAAEGRLRALSLFSGGLRLPHFTINRIGNFTMSLPGGDSINFGNFPAVGDTLSLNGTVGGSAVLNINQARLRVPGIVDLNLSGRITHDGHMGLTNSVNSAMSLLGFSARMTNLLSFVPGAYVNVVMADGPEAYWRLGDNYTSGGSFNYTVRDQTDRHTATLARFVLNGVNAIDQNEPGALDQDGNTAFRFGSGPATNSNQYVQVPDSPAFNVSDFFTIEAWVKVSAFDKSWAGIITKGDTSWRLHRYNGTSKISFGTYSTVNGWHDLPSTRDFDTNWHHIVATMDGTLKSLYVDGVLEATAQVSGPVATNAFPVCIGNNKEYDARSFNGWIDEVAFYRYALNGARVAEHYQAGKANGIVSTRLYLQNVGLNNTQLSGSLAASGKMSAHASGYWNNFVGLPFSRTDFDFLRDPGSSTARLSFRGVANLGSYNVPAPWGGYLGILDVNPTFQGQISYSGTRGTLQASASGMDAEILGYSFSGVNFGITNTTDTSALISWSNARLNLPILTPSNLPLLKGTLSTSTVDMTPVTLPNPLTLLGFSANSATLNFNHSQGLHVSGRFGFGFLGNLLMAGPIQPSGTLGLVCSDLDTVINGFNIHFTNPLRTIENKGNQYLSGAANLFYGNAQPPITFASANGKLSFSGNLTNDTGWVNFSPVYKGTRPVARFQWICAFSGDSATQTVSAYASGTAAVWNHPTSAPANIMDVPSGLQFNSFRDSKSANINSNGRFTFTTDTPIGDVSTFGFTLW